MRRPPVEKLADALLYEGYMLYPYRPSAVKNQQRFNFGVLYPPESVDVAGASRNEHVMRTECLLEGTADTVLEVRARFLHLVQRTVGVTPSCPERSPSASCDFVPVSALRVDDRTLLPWREAEERTIEADAVTVGELLASPRWFTFVFDGQLRRETVYSSDGRAVGAVQRRQEPLAAVLLLEAREVKSSVFRVSVEVRNVTLPAPLSGTSARATTRDALLLSSLVSAHTILNVRHGAFVSLLDPPAALSALAAECHGTHSWPVLVGAEGQRDTILASPIIMGDYPRIAPESAGDLFDGTEIDEILSLRILTLTDAEKAEMRESDEHARLLLARTEGLVADDLMRMHGTMREVHRESDVAQRGQP